METVELGPSLLAAFARVPGVRARHGRRYPLAALLTLATAAMLCGALSLHAIAQWGRLRPDAVRWALGVKGPRMPGITTLHYVFKRLEVEAFAAKLQAWAAQTLDPRAQQFVLDGKALRGIHGEELPGIRLVALYAPEAGLVLAQAGVRTKQEQAETADDRAKAKQEAELSVAPRLLEQVQPLLAGRMVSGDTRYCQKTLCRQLRGAGADYLFAVKDNQPSLHEDIRLLFTEPPPGEVFLTAQTSTKHGGRLERRQVHASACLTAYL